MRQTADEDQMGIYPPVEGSARPEPSRLVLRPREETTQGEIPPAEPTEERSRVGLETPCSLSNGR